MENFNTILLMFIIFILYQNSNNNMMFIFGIATAIFIIIEFFRMFCETKQRDVPHKK